MGLQDTDFPVASLQCFFHNTSSTSWWGDVVEYIVSRRITSMSASNDRFLRALQERHDAVKQALEEAVIGAPSGSLDQNHERAVKFVDSCKYLDTILASPDKPAWMSGALGCGIPFIQSKALATQAEFFKWLHNNGHIVRQQIVPLGDGAVNFDKVYGDVRDAGGIP